MKNIEHRTPNLEHRRAVSLRGHWMFDVRCSMFDVLKFAAFGRKPHPLLLKCGGLPTAATILILAIRIYRLVISPAQVFLFGSNSGCRFTPTCSAYAMDALREQGAVAGTALAMKRICRCHPWGGCGHDPVPESGKRKAESGKFFGAAH